jgi:hypothetical protein
MQILRIRNSCTSASHKCNFVLNQAKGRKSAVFFLLKENRQQTALAMPGHHALAQTAHSSHMLRPLTAPSSWHYRTAPCQHASACVFKLPILATCPELELRSKPQTRDDKPSLRQPCPLNTCVRYCKLSSDHSFAGFKHTNNNFI